MGDNARVQVPNTLCNGLIFFSVKKRVTGKRPVDLIGSFATTDELPMIALVLSMIMVKLNMHKIDFPMTMRKLATTVNVLSTVTFGRAMVMLV